MRRNAPPGERGPGRKRCEARAGSDPLRSLGAPPAAGRSKLTYKDQRDYDRLPGEIERLQARGRRRRSRAVTIPTFTRRDPDRFAELTERIARNRAEIEAAELRWLEVAEMAEAAQPASAIAAVRSLIRRSRIDSGIAPSRRTSWNCLRSNFGAERLLRLGARARPRRVWPTL